MNKNDTLLSESNFFYFLFVGHCLASLKATQNRECRKYLVKIIEKDIKFFFLARLSCKKNLDLLVKQKEKGKKYRSDYIY